MNNKGINLIALIIMIIIMIILAGIAINNSTTSVDKSFEAKAREERNQVAIAVSARFGEYHINSVASPIIGETIPSEYFSSDTDEENIENTKDYLVSMFRREGKMQTDDELYNHTIENQLQKFLEDNINDMEYTRILRHDDVIGLALDSISLASEFVVNYYSADVVGPIQ